MSYVYEIVFAQVENTLIKIRTDYFFHDCGRLQAPRFSSRGVVEDDGKVCIKIDGGEMGIEDESSKFVARYRESDGTPQSLMEHLEGVSALASTFSAKLGMATFGELCGLLHDLGKYSDAFQQYLKSAAGKIDPDDDGYVDARRKKGKIDHSSAGAQYLWNSFIHKDSVSQVVGQILALCIASHHSGLIDCLAPDGAEIIDGY